MSNLCQPPFGGAREQVTAMLFDHASPPLAASSFSRIALGMNLK